MKRWTLLALVVVAALGVIVGAAVADNRSTSPVLVMETLVAAEGRSAVLGLEFIAMRDLSNGVTCYASVSPAGVSELQCVK